MQDHFAESIHFTSAQYATLRENYRKWYAGELRRPIVPIVTHGHESCRKPSDKPFFCTATAWDWNIPVKDFIDSFDYYMSGLRFHGDAFPYFDTTRFGPGVLAAFLGCTPHGDNNTVWFEAPSKDIPIDELHFELDENNPCYRRVLNLYEAAMEKWRGAVIMGATDLGGILDVLASFRGSENLMLDLYDDPDEVKRCVWELQDIWFKCFDRMNEIIAPETPGYSHWYKMYCEEPGFILQSDFSYMIGPKMFAEFVAPELDSSANRIPYAVYHMDGVGQIPHLDQLLAMKGIRGIQWQPGEGTAMEQNWDELQCRIQDAGKKILHLNQKPDGSLADFVKDPGQCYLLERGFYVKDMDKAKAYAALHGIEI